MAGLIFCGDERVSVLSSRFHDEFRGDFITMQATMDHRSATRAPSPARGVERGLGAADLEVRLALQPDTRADAFALRHMSYLSQGYIDKRPDGLFSDAYDAALNCTTAVIYRGGMAVASARFCLLDREVAGTGIPAQEIFADAIDAAMAAGEGRPARRRALEINRLVRHPDHATDQMLVFAVFRIVSFMILRNDVDVAFSCVRPNHIPFYRRLRFRTVSEPRQYHGVKFATSLLALERMDYTKVLASAPLLDPARGSEEAYGRMLEGARVPVFGVTPS
jgi:hypothetical protein